MTWWGLGFAVVSTVYSSSEAEDAEDKQFAAANQGQNRADNLIAPYTQIGAGAQNALMELMGLSAPSAETTRLQSRLKEIDAQIAAGPPKKPKKRSGPFGSLLGGFIGSELSQHSLAANIGDKIDRNKAGDEYSFNLEALQSERASIQSQLEAQQAVDAQQSQGQSQQNTIDEINPILSFLRNEGFEDIKEFSAAQGKLGAGGTQQDLVKYNNDLAATIVPQIQNQRFNQLFNLLTSGQNASVGAGTNAINTQNTIGNNQYLAAANQANAINSGFQQVAQIGSQNPGAFNFLRTPPPSAGGIQPIANTMPTASNPAGTINVRAGLSG